MEIVQKENYWNATSETDYFWETPPCGHSWVSGALKTDLQCFGTNFSLCAHYSALNTAIHLCM